MDWSTIVQNVTMFVFGTGIFGWLFKSLYKNILDKDIEEFKHNLQQERITSSKLYDERVHIIAQLYRLLDDFNTEMLSLTCPLQYPNPDKNKKLKLAGEAGRKFVKYYSNNKIYFSEEINKLLNEINKEFKHAWIDFTTYPITDINEYESLKIQKDKYESLKKSWDTINKKIPPLKEKIEKEFRDILGVK